MDETIYAPLSQELESALLQGLAQASAFANVEGHLRALQVQEMYDSLLDAGFADNVDATIPLGLAFGQLLVDAGGHEWVRITDEYGAETCVAVRGKKLFCAPISMLQKRMKRGESVNIDELAKQTLDMLSVRAAESDNR